MGYEPKNRIEKMAFSLAGIKKTGSSNLKAGELAVATNYWLTLSNTSTVYSTVLLTIAAILFVEIKLWYIYAIPFIVSIICAIKTWVYSKCARETVSLWIN